MDVEALAYAPTGPIRGWDRKLYHWAFIRPLARMNQAVLLEWMTEMVEIAKQPLPLQRAGFQQLDSVLPSTKGAAPHLSLAMLLLPSYSKFVTSYHRNQALLQSTRVALAAERYRLAHGEWPESLEQLVPDFLDKVPDDPFQKKGPLRWLRLDDGIVIYSVGPDEIDDDGLIKTRSGSPPDYGFRLWDLEWRAQPPSPREPPDDK